VSGNVEVTQAAYAAFARGDIPAVLASMDPKVEWTDAEGFPYGGTYVGPDAVSANVFRRLPQEWDGFGADAEEFIDAGDIVFVLGTYRGTAKATGKSFRARFCHVWRLRDGKLARFEQFTDTLKVNDALQ
jgi:ketosteroid isomerase-like protein